MAAKDRSTAAGGDQGWVSQLPYVLFFFSGTAALGYQVVWARQFAAGLGHEFPAALAIVTAFMGGMALGAWAFGQFLEGRGRSCRWFGLLEMAIGVWAALLAIVAPAAMDYTRELVGFSPSPLRQVTIAFFSVLILLLPSTAAMGATLPAAALLVGKFSEGRTVPGLYAANTAGAMLGALGAAFLLMPLFGLRSAVLSLALMSVACGFAALKFSARMRDVQFALPKGNVHVPRALLFATGLLGIGLEVIAIRVLSNILENTIYTFATVLAFFLLGNAIGAWVYRRWYPRRRVVDPSIALVLLSFSGLLSGASGPLLLAAYQWLRSLLGDSAVGISVAEGVTSALMVLPPTILMGWIFAHYTSMAAGAPRGLSKAVAANSLGAMLAPALFGTVLIPAIGSKLALVTIGIAYLLLVPRRMTLLVSLPVLFLTAYILPERLMPLELASGEKIIAHKEGANAAVSVLENTNSQRVLKVNNRFQMGGTASRIAEQRHADIPLLLHPNPKDALFLGLGTGITFQTAEEHPGLLADGVELLPEVARMMPFFSEGGEGDNFAPPGLQVYIADARRFVQTSRKKYDVIVADLFHPAQDGVGFLYTREHFAAAGERLKDDGLFCQWLPLYQLDVEGLRMITATFLSVFPSASAWLLRPNIETPVIGLVGRVAEKPIPTGTVENRLADRALASHLRQVALGDSIRLFGCFVADAEALRRFVAGVPLATDNHPRILFHAPRYTYNRREMPSALLLRVLGELQGSPRSILAGDAAVIARVESYITARDVYLHGLARESQGAIKEAIGDYIRSAQLSGDFTLGYAQGITIATALLNSNRTAAREILIQLVAAQPERPVAKQMLERFFPASGQTTDKAGSLE